MPRWLSIALLGSLVGVLAPSTAVAAKPCGKYAGDTTDRNQHVRVYSQETDDERRYFACSRSTGRVTFLGISDDLGTSFGRDVRLAGRFVQWSETFYRAEGRLRVGVADVRAGEVTRRWRFNHWSGSLEPLQVFRARLKRNGSFAFVVGIVHGDNESDPDYRRYEVHRADSQGKVRLDASREIDPESFMATADTITWTRGGVLQTANFR